MNQNSTDKNNQATYKLVADLFNISAIYESEHETILTLIPIYKKEITIKLLKDRLKLADYTYSIQDTEDQIILKLNGKPTYKIPM